MIFKSSTAIKLSNILVAFPFGDERSVDLHTRLPSPAALATILYCYETVRLYISERVTECMNE